MRQKASVKIADGIPGTVHCKENYTVKKIPVETKNNPWINSPAAEIKKYVLSIFCYVTVGYNAVHVRMKVMRIGHNVTNNGNNTDKVFT
jgi:hypothetical protein